MRACSWTAHGAGGVPVTTGSRGGRGSNSDAELGEAAQDEVVPEADVGVDQAQIGEAPDEGADGDLALEASEGGAQAVV
jgi:hypothetical protein